MEPANRHEKRATDAQLDAVTVLSELQTSLSGLPEHAPEYRDLFDRRLIAAAEALNLGLDAQAIQAIGGFSDTEMRQVRVAAEEFWADDPD